MGYMMYIQGGGVGKDQRVKANCVSYIKVHMLTT